MRVETLRYTKQAGWSEPFPAFDPERSLVLCFGAPGYLMDTDPIREAATGIGGLIVGCSTAGEILGSEITDESLVVAVAEFASTPIRRVVEPITAHTSFDAGVAIGRQLADEGLRSVFVLSDGLDVNGTALVRGISSILPDEVIVTGGLAGDGSRFEQTWVIVDDKPVSGFVTAIGFYGDSVRVGHGSKGGWDQFGPERTVTKAKGNVVFELDNHPILELYKEYLGELAEELPASGLLFPLALRDPSEEKQLVRTILAVDEATQSMTFAGDVPQGYRVQLMQANFDRLVDGAEDAAESALGTSSDSAELSIAISCVGRRLVLGERTEDELDATLDVLPNGISQVGFYSYGEISPFAEGSCDLHNQTMTLTTIGELA